MGYYTIKLDKSAQKVCTIVTPVGKYAYLRLPMGINCAPDIFQAKMNNIMSGLEYVRTYLDDLLILSNGDFMDHLSKVKTVLQRLSRAGLKVHRKKSIFGNSSVEYLGYVITREGLRPQQKRIQTILDLAVPKTVKGVRQVLGILNYYRDLWPQRSRTLAPLHELTRTQGTDKNKNAKITWLEKHEKAFQDMKKIVAREALLAYPDFGKPFEIYTDACDVQLGSVITQNKKPLAFYSRKLNAAQKNYTTQEKELLSVVETVKEFKTILFGHELIVWTDHKNLTHETLLLANSRVLRWRLMLEEYKITFKYITGAKNTFADALSRLDTLHPCPSDREPDPTEEVLALTAHEKEIRFPMETSRIHQEQQKELKADRALRLEMRKNKKYKKTRLHNMDIYMVDRRIYVPKSLRHEVLTWYHHYLCHPGATRLEKTIAATMTWP